GGRAVLHRGAELSGDCRDRPVSDRHGHVAAMAGPTVPAPGAARLLRARTPRALGRGGVSGRETRAMTRQTSASAMTCQDVLERVDLYLDRGLRPAERRAVEAHLLVCAGCRGEVEAAGGVGTQARNGPPDQA